MKIAAVSSAKAGTVRCRMSSIRAAALSIALLVLVPGLAATAAAQGFGVRSVQGHVLDAQSKPINGAIVYLRNSSTNDIKTYISTDSGSYQFVDLAANSDYTLWAAWKGRKSSTHTISSFDTRKKIHIDLQIK